MRLSLRSCTTMHILLDFDGTLTVRDTIGALARAAIAFQSARDGRGAARSAAAWAGRWQAIVDAYAADYQAHSAAYPAPAAHYYGKRSSSATAEKRAYHNSLRAVERRSVQRVKAAGLFAKMGPAQLEAAGRRAAAGDSADDAEDKVELRSGVARLFAEAAARQWPVSVVSVNWSDAWVRGVLSSVVAADTMATVPVLANTTTDAGGIVRNMSCPNPDDDGNEPLLTAADKLEALEWAIRGTQDPFVYVGDSLTDLDCLLHAAGTKGSVGIVMAGSGEADSALLRTMGQMGYSVPHVSECAAGVPNAQGSGLIAWAHDFVEVAAWLFTEE